MKRIYLFGSFNCDLTIRAPYLPEAGETLKGSDFLVTAGGKGANQAYACAVLGAETVMAGAVGDDVFADRVLAGLKGAGVKLRVRRVKGKSTGVAVITVVDGENRIILDEGANACVTREDAEVLLIDARRGDLFMTQLETPLAVVCDALRMAKEKGLYTALNPAPALADARRLAPYCDLMTPNRKELALLTGKEGLEEGIDDLLEAGAKRVLVTLGERGSRYADRTQRFDVAAFDAGEAVDTTAAGDTFCGALCVRLAEGAQIADAARFASVCAGIAVTRRGAQVSIPKREEVERILS